MSFFILRRLKAALFFFAVANCFGCAPAHAWSDNSSHTYSGDYAGGSAPDGTFVINQYFGHVHADTFNDLTGAKLPGSKANVFYEITRFTYLTRLFGNPFVIEGDLPFVTLTDVKIPGTNSRVAGGMFDPVIHLTYFPVADPVAERWIGVTNYFYLPLGRSFANDKAINVSTARQFTDVVQIGYTEGLGKFSPSLAGFFVDVIANGSFHTDGASPIFIVNPASARVPGVLAYDRLTQRPSYTVTGFLRYAPPKTRYYFALGLEKSWGGKQVAVDGKFAAFNLPIVLSRPDLPLTKDEYLRGHFQVQIPLTADVSAAADVIHDFNAIGGFRQNIGIELRLTKVFLP